MRIGRLIIAIVGLFLVILLIVWGLRALFGGTDEPQQPVASVTSVAENASTATVRWVQSDPIVAPEDHFEVSITISASTRELIVSRGYEGANNTTETFGNDQLSFNAFAAALDQYGFLNIRPLTPPNQVRESACPNGNRYSYQYFKDTTVLVHNTWSTSCGPRLGDFGGNASSVRKLFQAQIPDYNKLVNAARKSTPDSATISTANEQ